jgi:hypothetical protein
MATKKKAPTKKKDKPAEKPVEIARNKAAPVEST